LEPSKGLLIVSGEPSWKSVLSPGTEEVLEVSLKLVGPVPQQIAVRLRGRLPDGERFEITIVRRVG